MIKHVVMWSLKNEAEGATRAENASSMKVLLDACANVVPGTLAYEVALANPKLESTCDVILYSVFEDKAALDAYQEHPAHLKAKAFIGAVRETRQCLDYEV